MQIKFGELYKQNHCCLRFVTNSPILDKSQVGLPLAWCGNESCCKLNPTMEFVEDSVKGINILDPNNIFNADPTQKLDFIWQSRCKLTNSST